ncbi:MAG TPA: SET domain-containing protein-lysine N-methyltransferase [Bryobacteraceae bacterium]
MAKLVRAPSIDAHYACFKMAIRPSTIHRYGVYAQECIPANRKVIEYTGERINRREAKSRADGQLTYLFALDPYWTLDGAVGGSGAEIINHSCDPNLISRVMKGHVLYMSLREIELGEELTVDYHLDWNPPPTPCRCGTAKCRGTLEIRRRGEIRRTEIRRK